MILTYLDANILIAAAKGTEACSRQAMEIIDDTERNFAASLFLKLEVLPSPEYEKRTDEVAFMKIFFGSVSIWTKIDEDLVQAACDESARTNLKAIDALHVLSASAVGADEFVTQENPRRPYSRTKLITVKFIS